MNRPFNGGPLNSGLRTIADWLLDLRTAAGFLTRLPVGPSPVVLDSTGQAEPSERPGYLARSMAMFPLVGAAVGLAAGLALLGAHALGLHPLGATLIGLAVAVALTGALHEDGLADFCDGLGGGRDREDRLRIMRDSRIGTYGALAIVFSVGLKAGILSGLPSPAVAAAALVAAGALSRAALPAIVLWLPPARSEGMAAEAGRTDLPRAAAGIVVAFIVGVLVLGEKAGGTALLAATGAAAGVAVVARSALGGHTGDVLGATQQAAEMAVLVAVAVIE